MLGKQQVRPNNYDFPFRLRAPLSNPFHPAPLITPLTVLLSVCVCVSVRQNGASHPDILSEK